MFFELCLLIKILVFVVGVVVVVGIGIGIVSYIILVDGVEELNKERLWVVVVVGEVEMLVYLENIECQLILIVVNFGIVFVVKEFFNIWLFWKQFGGDLVSEF